MFLYCHLHVHTISLFMTFPLWIPFENEWWTFFALLIIILSCVLGSEVSLKLGWLSGESNRRLIHFLVGIMVACSPMIFQGNILPSLLALIFIIMNIITFNKEQFKGIHSQSRITYGTIYFPIGYLVMVIGFWGYPEFVIIALSLLAFCDPIAAQVGENVGSKSQFIIWKDKKTIPGTVAFFISAMVIIYMFSKWFFNHPNIFLLFFALFIAIAATAAEITSCKGSDNFSIPIISILFMIGFFFNFEDSSNNMMHIMLSRSSILVILVICLFGIAYWFNSLNINGLFGAIIMAIVIIMLGSDIHLISLAIFFVFSSVISKTIKNKSFYRSKGSKRDIIQVYANGGVATLVCIVDFLYPNPFNIYLFLASVAAAMSDTWGTEFGKLSKHKPISIISFRPMEHGLSGGLTRIGTLGSLLGSCIIGFTAWFLIPMESIIIYGIIFSGFIAAIVDSLAGAIFQAKYETQTGEIIEEYQDGSTLISGNKWINNDIVNLINTIAAPLFMYIFLLIK